MGRPLLEARDLQKSYGRQVVLDGVSFLIGEAEKIALIGRNGAGKTTLFHLLTEEETADVGTVSIFPSARIGIIKQHELLPGDCSCQTFLETSSERPSWEVSKLASQFGLDEYDLAKPPTALSGGYQMRVKLVAMLLQDPNLLLLDEPVNYLDLNTLLLLEQFLQTYRGAFVIIAHDREFLQNTCTHTIEIERGKLITYNGTVSDYLEWKEEQEAYRLRSNKRLAREIAHQQKFVDRFRYKASLATRAQSKLKHITKLRHQIAHIDASLATTRIVIPSPIVPNGTALDVTDLIVGYGDRVIGSDIRLHIKRGEKVVIAGENGRGKTTLLKTLAGKLEPLGGTMKWWHRADIGYYDQKTDASLSLHETVLSHLTRMAPVSTSAERILGMASNFLFRDDDLDKKVAVLSGGERARLALAGVLLHEHNVLLLDEPTNHLDVETTESLAVALKAYTGTVLFVSHARTFVNTLADRILEVRNGTLRMYRGSYEDYVEDLSALAEIDESPTSEPVKNNQKEERAENRLKIKELERSQALLQKSLSALDREKSEILAFFFENPTDYAPEKATRLEEIKVEEARLEKEWYQEEEILQDLKNNL